MSTINEQLDKLTLQVAANLAAINSLREQGLLYVFLGDVVKYGCYCHASDTQTLHFDDSDVATKNPNLVTPAKRTEEYPNIALTYGEVVLLDFPESSPKVFDYPVTDNPSAGFTRKDLVYVYFGDSGPNVAISQGVASNTVPVDPTPPLGTMTVARVTVGETGISLVEDLRTF